MPNVITHGLMANEVVQLLDDSEVAKAIHNYPRCFFFGSNGPDFLFYYRYFSSEEDAKSMRELGNYLHDNHINEFYTAAKEFISQLEREQDKQMALSYVAGHLCHWALDSLAHPYVFHKTGLIEGETRYDHFKMEAMIDTLMIKQVKLKKFKDVPSYKFVELSQPERIIIAKEYQFIVKKVMGQRIELTKFVNAIKSMYQFNLLLFDKNGLRTKLVKPIEKFILRDDWVFTSHVVSPKLDLKHDVLNLKKEEWSHPCYPELKYHSSFVDLFDQSTIRAREAINAFEKDLNQGTSSCEQFIDGRNYSTGCNEPCDMINFNIIYEH